MKRADLEVGGAYYHKRGSYGSGEKAVVLDGKKWKRRSGWSGGYYEADDGNLVHVEITKKPWRGDEVLEKTYVTLASLHGPWEKLHAAEVEEERIAKEKRDAADAEYDRLVERTDAVKELSRMKGISFNDQRRPDGWIQVKIEDLAELLENYQPDVPF